MLYSCPVMATVGVKGLRASKYKCFTVMILSCVTGPQRCEFTVIYDDQELWLETMMVGWMCFNAAFQWLSLHFAYMNIHVLMELSYIFQWHYAAKVHGLSRRSLSHVGPSEYMNNILAGYNDTMTALWTLALLLVPTFIVLSLWQGHCESSLGSCDECRLSTKQPPTLRPSQPTWAVSLPVGWLQLSTPTVTIYYYYSAPTLILVLQTSSGG